RALPAGLGHPVARRRRRPHQAPPRRPPGTGRLLVASQAPAARRGTAMTALELRGVSKVYGVGPTEVHALRNVDLCVDAGVLVAVMGPSGSGKSTLLTIAGSLEEPTSGEV